MNDKPQFPRVYLGDGLYASFDGYQIALAASDGVADVDTVYLEPAVLAAFERYVANLRASLKASGQAQ
jgi:hypothetical protein